MSNDVSQSLEGDGAGQKRGRQFMCKICYIEGQGVLYLDSQKSLNKHTRDVHFCVFTCKTHHCYKVFSSLSALKKHKLTHNPLMNTRYPCDKCEKSFVFASELRNHQVVHSEMHHFKYKHCPYTFILKGELMRHELRHTGKILWCEVEN